ncbi:MAG: hypothetical protein ACSLFK_09145 [Gemmatimonadaceae bacterium]
MPSTIEQVQQLRSQRDELSSQLSSVVSRRRQLVEEIRSAPEGASRTGLEDRLRVLDQRIVQLENDLTTTGRLLAGSPAELVGETLGPPSGGDDFETGVVAGGFFSLLFAIPVVLYLARRRWRKRAAKPARELSGEVAQRLERLEHGMESIAVEIERVSEGQRFVTKVLSGQSPIDASNRVAARALSENDPQ